MAAALPKTNVWGNLNGQVLEFLSPIDVDKLEKLKLLLEQELTNTQLLQEKMLEKKRLLKHGGVV